MAWTWDVSRLMGLLSRVTLFLLFLGTPLYAWDSTGHAVVALLAESRLTPSAQATVAVLLGKESLVDSALWADQVRSKQTAPWHYVNIEIGESQYEPDRHCPKQQCVIGQIERFRHTLGDPTVGISKRRKALKYLMHFVADLHQPLHAGQHRDRGGNDVKVEFLGQTVHPFTKRPWNLHQVWDEGLIARYDTDSSQAVGHLTRWLAIQDESALAQGSVVDWAMESHDLARDHAYTFPSSNQLDEDYLERTLPIVEAQLAKAGVRLAAILNQAFASR